MEELLEQKKADQITPDEIAELDAIGELDRIFTHINAMLAAQNANRTILFEKQDDFGYKPDCILRRMIRAKLE